MYWSESNNTNTQVRLSTWKFRTEKRKGTTRRAGIKMINTWKIETRFINIRYQRRRRTNPDTVQHPCQNLRWRRKNRKRGQQLSSPLPIPYAISIRKESQQKPRKDSTKWCPIWSWKKISKQKYLGWRPPIVCTFKLNSINFWMKWIRIGAQILWRN